MHKLPVVGQRLVKKDVDPLSVLAEAAKAGSSGIELDRTAIGTVATGPIKRASAFDEAGEGLQLRRSIADIRVHTAEDDRARRQYGEALARIAALEEELLRLRLGYEAEQGEVARLRDELARRARDVAALTAHVDTLTHHLEASRATDSNTFLHSQKDLVIEVESLKARLSRAERERDAVIFQLQETERRTRMEREEESALREGASTRAAENERRAAYAELQRVRAEAEASAARQQTEHWRSAARAAQEEVAALRAHLEMTGGRSVHLARTPPGGVSRTENPSSFPPGLASQGRLSDTQIAGELVRRQQQAAQNGTPLAAETARKHAEEGVKQRLGQIGVELNRLEEQMENMGPSTQRTLAQRLQREQLRRQMDELNKEAARLRASLLQSAS